MAKVIVEPDEVIIPRWWDNMTGIITGALVGLVWYVSWIILDQYALEPLAAGGVAHVISVTAGTLLLVRLFVARPLIISIGSMAILWTLGGALVGLGWGETLIWSVGLFMLSYGLLQLVAHVSKLWLAMAITVGIVVVTQIVLAL